MFTFIRGLIDTVRSDKGEIDLWVLNECGDGVGYTLLVNTGDTVFKEGERVSLYVYSHIYGQGALTFQYYGFLERKDLVLFREIVALDGISGKKAYQILLLGGDTVRGAIGSKNADTLCRATGVGRKLAMDIIGKLHGVYSSCAGEAPGVDPQMFGVLVGMLHDMYQHRKGSIEAWLKKQEFDWTLSQEALAAECLKRYAQALEDPDSQRNY